MQAYKVVDGWLTMPAGLQVSKAALACNAIFTQNQVLSSMEPVTTIGAHDITLTALDAYVNK